jgi:hypothetical protein
MHVRGYQVTTASMVAELPRDAGTPVRAWIALGSPCVGVYVPVFPTSDVPAELSNPETWARFARLRDRAEGAGGTEELAEIRSVLGPVESDLWEEADETGASGDWRRIDDALTKLRV